MQNVKTMNCRPTQHIFTLGFLLALLSITGAPPSYATEFETGERIRISNLHTIEDDLFVWSYSITNDGLIDGDAFLGGYEIASNGEVSGSQNVFAYTFNHSGEVGRSLRVFANYAAIGGITERSLLVMGATVILEPDAVVNRDAHLFGEVAHVEGHIRGNLKFEGKRIEITGSIDGDVEIEADEIIIDPPAVISGNFTYRARKSIAIDSLGGAAVLGSVSEMELSPDDDTGEAEGDFTDITFILSKFLAAFLFGIIIIALFRRYADETYRQLKSRLGLSAVSGLVTFLVTGFCIAILLISLILVIIGLALASQNEVILGSLILVVSTLLVPITSFASVSGFILLYMGKIVVAMLVGCMIWRQFKTGCAPLSKIQLFVGLAVLTALFQVPYVGFALYLIASIIGTGGIVLGIRNCHRPATTVASANEVEAKD